LIESLRQDNERDAAGINHEKTGTRDDDTARDRGKEKAGQHHTVRENL